MSGTAACTTRLPCRGRGALRDHQPPSAYKESGSLGSGVLEVPVPLSRRWNFMLGFNERLTSTSAEAVRAANQSPLIIGHI